MCICTSAVGLYFCYCRIAQVKSAQQKAADDLYIACYCDNEELNCFLKQIIRDDDPMLAFIKKKPKKGAVCLYFNLFIISFINLFVYLFVERPMYKRNQPFNRYGIHAGFRWDGIDRSNGMEKFYLANTKGFVL